jgi:hypothetical protein
VSDHDLQARVPAEDTGGSPDSLRPGLSAARAADDMATVNSPYVYSMLTVDGHLTPDDYEPWLANALPHLLLTPELPDV